MPDDNALPWADQQWDELRAVALEAARKSRVASTFLPLVGPMPAEQSTVASNWIRIPQQAAVVAGQADNRLEVEASRTLPLVTLACNLYLRGAEVADPDLDAAKTMTRRAGEVLGRLEDAVVFHGVAPEGQPEFGNLVIQPQIYTITGGRNLTGLLQTSETQLVSEAAPNGAPQPLVALRDAGVDLFREHRRGVADQALTDAEDAYQAAENAASADLMSIRLPLNVSGGQLVTGVVDAIQRLEELGHFGPFAVVLGHGLFRAATTPTGSLVLPTDRLAEFLDGRRVQRSGVLPPNKGLVVALGGQPIELVLASDIDVRFLQATLEPRYVLRVFERLVLRIKELNAVCTLTTGDRLLDPAVIARWARP